LEKSTHISTGSLIDFDNFSFRYSEDSPFILKKINLHINKGDIVLLGGISGSGKSTLCNAISGNIPFKISGQMKGMITLFDKDIWDYKIEDISKEVSYIFQNAEEQLVTFSVFDEIAFAPENFKNSPQEIRDKVTKIAIALNIEDLLNRSIFSLSGGEKQKVILAANLVMEPKILILDEPLAFLDKNGEEKLIQLLEKLHELRPEMAIFIVEHRLKPFKSLLNRMLLLDDNGKIVFDNNLIEYYNFIKTEETIFLRDDDNNSLSSKKIKLESDLKLPKETQKKAIFEIQSIKYQYPNSEYNVFDNYSLNIYENDFLGIVGDNGTGKTTLLYLIARILDPIKGNMKFRNQPYDEIEIEKFIPKIGFIFQNPETQLFESTVKDEILFAPRNFWNFECLKKEELKEETVNKLIRLIGENKNSQKELRKTNPFCLSWGQKRRLNLAGIFSYEPDILLIDEPFIGQDADSVERIFQMLHDFHKMGKVIVIVSHDRELLSSHCNRMVTISENNQSSSERSNKTETVPNQINEKIIPKKHKINQNSENKKKRKISKINLFIKQSLQFQPGNTWAHKLNPVTKLILLIIYSFFIFYQTSLIIMFISFLLALIAAKSANVTPNSLFKQVKIILYFTLVYIPINAIFDASFYPSNEILFYLYKSYLPIRRHALYFSLRTGLLILNLLTTAVIFTRTTSPKDLAYSIIQVGIPYRFAFSFMIGLRYIPLIQNDATTIEIAQKLRGAGLRKGSSIKRIYFHIIHRITTLIITVLRKAKTTSMAIEARGFGSHSIRTNLHYVKWGLRDISFITAFLLILIYVIIFPIKIPSLYSMFKRIFQ
jgi:energy-coupling factor transporter ATP-binding protein EcfA2